MVPVPLSFPSRPAFVLAAGLLLAVGLAVLNAAAASDRAVAAAVARSERAALASADEVHLRLRSQMLATADLVDAIARHGPDLPLAVQQALRRRHPQMRTMLAIDPAGRVRTDLRDGAPAKGILLGDRGYVRAHLDGPFVVEHIGSPVYSRHDGEWSLPISMAVRADDGTLQAIAATGVGAEYFAPLVEAHRGLQARVYFRLREGGVPVAIDGQPISDDEADRLQAGFDAFRDLTAEAAPIGVTVLGEGTQFLRSPDGRFDLMLQKPAAVIAGYGQRAFVGRLSAGLGVIACAALAILLAHRTICRLRLHAQRAEELERRLRLSTEAGGVGIWDYDLRTGVLNWDATMHRIFDTPPEAFDGTIDSWRRKVHPEDRVWVESRLMDSVKAGGLFESIFRIVHGDGTERVIEAWAKVDTDAAGQAIRLVGANFDITDQITRERDLADARETAEAAQAKMLRDALHDPLTDLANRRGLDREIAARADDPSGAGGLIVSVDLDRLKTINDMHGHRAGDAMLVHVAQQLRSQCRTEDFVARIGGDEFLVIADSVADPHAAAALARDIVRAVTVPLLWEGRVLEISASAGYALDCAGEGLEAQIAHADLALYKAKEAGRNKTMAFTASLSEAAQRRRALSEDLRQALANGDLEPWYQAQFRTADGALFGAEALVRWRHPDGHLVSPAVFLPIADEMRLTEEIDRLVLQRATADLTAWDAAGVSLPKLSVNLSARRMLSPDLMRDIDRLPPALRRRLSFEVLESVYVEDKDSDVVRMVQRIRDSGIAIEIDDFGSGHASVASIVALSPDYIKLDRMFARNIEHNPERLALLHSLIGVARSVHIPVIAEGVETQAQAGLMASAGCVAMQGFGLAEPMPEVAFRPWIARFSAPSSVAASA